MKFNSKINNIFRKLKKKKIITIMIAEIMIICKIAVLISIQMAVDSISLNNIDVTRKYLLYTGIFLVLFFVSNCIMQLFFRNLQYTSQYVLLRQLFDFVLKKDCTYHEKYTPAISLSMIKDDSKIIADWKSIGIITLYGNIFSVLIVFATMIYYDVYMALFIGVAIVVCFLVTFLVSKKIGSMTYDLQRSYSILSDQMLGFLYGIKDIKQYRKEKFFSDKISEFIENDTYQYSKKISVYYSVFAAVYSLLSVILPVLVILVGLLFILNGSYTLGKLMTTYALVCNLQEPIIEIPNFFNQYRQAIAMQEKILPILNENLEEYKLTEIDKMKLFKFSSEGFTYKNGKKILQNLKFIVQRGEIIFIKGESGKGKSSLLNIVSRFSNIEKQTVKMEYNAQNVEMIERKAYYEHVLQVLQNPYIFQDTIINNITLEDPYCENEIKEVISVTCLEKLIDEKGKDYLLEKNGENLSGGQKQRISLARALIRKPDILMLDEPISGLNSELADLISENVIRFCQKYNIALLIASHNNSFERYLKSKREKIKVVEV